MQLGDLVFLEMKGGRGIDHLIIGLGGGSALERGVQNDERVARFATKLQNEKIVSRDAHGREIDGHLLAALRAAHLLLDASDDLLERMRVEFHGGSIRL